MAGYFGTEMQRRLQAQAEASIDFIQNTPGACQVGRMMGCDDPDRLGWSRIDEFINRDGACGFRLIPGEQMEEIKSRLKTSKRRFDSWDVYIADRETAVACCDEILSRSLPEGLANLDMPSDPESTATKRIQALMADAGVVPFSGSLLTGSVGRATTVAIGDQEGTVVAAAHGYLPHNVHSPYHRYAWGGLVAVAEAYRGRGLGNRINARMIANVFRDLDATHIYELVSVTNISSRRMVEACGLRLQPSLVCGIAAPDEATRFTR